MGVYFGPKQTPVGKAFSPETIPSLKLFWLFFTADSPWVGESCLSFFFMIYTPTSPFRWKQRGDSVQSHAQWDAWTCPSGARTGGWEALSMAGEYHIADCHRSKTALGCKFASEICPLAWSCLIHSQSVFSTDSKLFNKENGLLVITTQDESSDATEGRSGV